MTDTFEPITFDDQPAARKPWQTPAVIHAESNETAKAPSEFETHDGSTIFGPPS